MGHTKNCYYNSSKIIQSLPILNENILFILYYLIVDCILIYNDYTD